MNARTVVELDPHDEAHLRAIDRLDQRVRSEWLPDEAPRPYEQLVDELHRLESWKSWRYWGVWADGSDLVGFSFVELEHGEANAHLAWSDVKVAPDERGGGVGRALLAPVVDAARDHGASFVLGVCPEYAPTREFCEHVGGETVQAYRESRLLTGEIDRALMSSWVTRAAERGGGYELVHWDGPCPPEWIEAFVAIKDIQNTAPADTPDQEHEVYTVERVQDTERRRAATGEQWWVAAVRDRASGAFAGYTIVFFARHQPDLAWQGWTVVDPAHRERGLGRWLKAAVALRLLEERPEVRRIETDNASANAAMLSINLEMGFRTFLVNEVWQVGVEALAKAIGR